MFAAGLSWDVFYKYVGLIIFIFVPFGYFISDSRTFWKKKTFWAFLVACLSVHCAVWAAIIPPLDSLNVFWLLIIAFAISIELVALLFLRNLLLLNPHEKS